MRVVLFKGASAYGATRTFIDEAPLNRTTLMIRLRRAKVSLGSAG